MSFTFVSAAATQTKTVTKSVTAGNLLVCCFACGDGTSNPTISDGVNNWQPVPTSPFKDGTNAASASMWWAIAATTGSITITITAGAASFNGTSILEYSGTTSAATNAGGQGATSNVGTGANAVTTGNFTPTASNCLIVSLIVNDGSAPTATFYTAGTSPNAFTKRPTGSVDPGGAGAVTYAVEDFVQGAAAAINPTWTQAVGVTDVGIGAAFAPGVAVTAIGEMPTPVIPLW